MISKCLLLILLWWGSQSGAAVLELADTAGGQDAARYVTLWRDSGGHADLAAAQAAYRAGGFQPTDGVTDFGFDSAAYWFRLDLRRPEGGPATWWVEVPYPGLDDVRLYAPGENGGIEVQEVGDHQPFSHRPIQHRYFVLPIHLPADGVTTVYLRVQTADTLTVPIRVWLPTSFAAHDSKETLLAGAYYGLILAMLVYNFFLFLKLRDSLYAYYLVFSAATLMFVAELNGQTFQYLWPDNLWLADRQHVILPALLLITSLLFIRRFFDLKATMPWLDRVLRGLVAVVLVDALIGLTISYPFGHKMLIPLALLALPVGMVAGVAGIVRGSRPARYFVAAQVFFQAGIFVVVMTGAGWWSADILIQQAMSIGSALEVLVFSLALAERIALVRQEKEAAMERAMLAEKRIIDVDEETQRRIGRELHDDLGQHLAGIAFLSKTLSSKLEDKDVDEFKRALEIMRLTNGAIAKTRLLARGLCPVNLEEGGLAVALEQLAQSTGEIFGVECVLRCTEEWSLKDPLVAINLFRIAQEAVNNAIKHGRARHITIELAQSRDHTGLTVSDDGVGFDPVMGSKDGLGLASMRYRAQRMGARLEIVRRDAGGMRVSVDLARVPQPLPDGGGMEAC